MIVQTVTVAFRIGGVSCSMKYFEGASSINFKRSVQYGVGALAEIASFVAHKLGIIDGPRFDVRGRKLAKSYEMGVCCKTH